MAAKSLDFVIRAQDRFSKDMERFNAKLAKMDKNVKKSQKTMSAFTGFKAIGGLLGVGAGGIGAVAIKTGIAFNVLEENALLAFETMIRGAKPSTTAIGDIGQQFTAAQRAAALFQGVSNAALKQPFKLTDLIPATQKLLAFGFTAETIPVMINEIADAAAGLGGSPEMLDRIAMAFGQINTKGKVSGEEMMQLAEAGIPAWQMLAENIGMVGPQFAKMQAAIDSGALPIEKAVQMTMKLGEQGKLNGAGAIAAMRRGLIARFGGLGEKLSKTTAGAFSNLVDELEKLAAELNKPAFQAAAQVIKDLTGSVNGLRTGFQNLPPEVQTFLGYAATLAMVLGAGGALAGSLAFMIGGVGGLGALGAGLLAIAGPAGLIALAIAGVAALAIAWNKDFLGVKTNTENLLSPLGKVGDLISGMVGTNPVLISMALGYTFAKKIWDWLFDGADAPGNKAISTSLDWVGETALGVGRWLQGSDNALVRNVGTGLTWVGELALAIGKWVAGDSEPISRILKMGLAWGTGLGEKIGAWVEGTGISRGVTTNLTWASGLPEKIGGWIEGGGITRGVSTSLTWASGLGTSMGAWLEGSGITRYITAGLSWASTGITSAIGGWIAGGTVSNDLQRGVQLALGFNYASYVLGMFLASPAGTVMDRTIELFVALTEESKALLIGQIYRTANVAIALYGDTWEMVKGWSEQGSELLATVWANFTLKGVDWGNFSGWLTGTVSLEKVIWADIQFWGDAWLKFSGWMKGDFSLSRVLKAEFQGVGDAWSTLQTWGEEELTRGLKVWISFYGFNWWWLEQWKDKGADWVTRTVGVSFNLLGSAMQLWSWITGGSIWRTSVSLAAEGNIPLGTGKFVPQMAAGGIVNSPTLAMIGEAGPEAVIPLSRGRGAMGGGSNIYITNTFTNTGVVTTNDVQAWFRRMQDEGRARGVAA